MGKDISSLRQEYKARPLIRANLLEDPLEQFSVWLNESLEAQLVEPNAFSFATVGLGGVPAIRTLLLKGLDQSGLAFFTNYESSKALDMENNSEVAMLFPWIALGRQVKVLGKVQKVGEVESLKYFKSRPLGAQLGAWASRQSEPIESRRVIEDRFEEVQREFKDKAVPLPPFWGGYRVEPRLFEFWQGRADRLHDRFEYRLVDGNWIIGRLSP